MKEVETLLSSTESITEKLILTWEIMIETLASQPIFRVKSIHTHRASE